MQKVITSDRLALYQKYDGSEEAWSQRNLPDEQALFGDDSDEQSDNWMAIGSAIQDVLLIRRGLVSSAYKQEIMGHLGRICDEASFGVLTKGIG